MNRYFFVPILMVKDSGQWIKSERRNYRFIDTLI